ncbi:hypothetical protein G647_00753 [Cladophialophora carrionii CBS 160.54]|uniref:Major facilitator superfamily (MFS) profile domain-containing protein n=1 Tax=Cladophialophora carrionii CBS 160.54 TaxID=1279043 RepID=V9DN20_9EURO|nr:uncharacterized protein G647_00753 [Cladophialophora carrionii CBS 160.54]ETI28304.1 hypothetical protein G647_00753 [Cladophialophora carrionii CBS 160.54]
MPSVTTETASGSAPTYEKVDPRTMFTTTSPNARTSSASLRHEVVPSDRAEPHDNPTGNPEAWTAGRAEILAIVSLAIISLVVALDSTILVPVLPVLAIKLNGSAIETFWAGTSYLLASATLQPLTGAMSDIFGRRCLLLINIGLFALGSLLACLAHDFRLLLCGRTIQGVGGGGIIVLNLIICTDIIPLRQRPRFTSYVQISWGIGTLFGPLIGAAFAERVTWRWIFYINFPICGIGAFLIAYSIRFTDRQISFAQKWSEVDWIGGIFFLASITSTLLALTWGGVQFPWDSWQTLLPLLLGLVGLLGTTLWEIKGARRPFLRISLFSSISSIAIYTCAIFQGVVLYGLLYFVSFYFLSVRGFSNIETGVALLPLSCALMPASILVGIAMTRLGRFRWALWSGWSLSTLGVGLLILFDTSSPPTYGWVLVLVVNGIGQGLLLNSLNLATNAISSTIDVAYSSTMYAFFRGTGLCIGVAVGGSTFQNRLTTVLRASGLPTAIAQNAEAYIATLHSMPKDDPFRKSVISAYAQAFHTVFIVLTAFSAASLVVTVVGVRHHTMDKSIETQHKLQRREATRATDKPSGSSHLPERVEGEAGTSRMSTLE